MQFCRRLYADLPKVGNALDVTNNHDILRGLQWTSVSLPRCRSRYNKQPTSDATECSLSVFRPVAPFTTNRLRGGSVCGRVQRLLMTLYVYCRILGIFREEVLKSGFLPKTEMHLRQRQCRASDESLVRRGALPQQVAKC